MTPEQEELLAEIQIGLDQADRGLAKPLDVEELIKRCTQKLAQEGIRD